MAIINEYEVVREGLAALLAPYADNLEFVGFEPSGPDGTRVDIAMWDTFAAAQGDKTDVARLVHQEAVERVVVYSWNVDQPLIDRTLAAGVSGYLAKSLSAAAIADRLGRIGRGEIIVERGDGSVTMRGPWPGREDGLSPRQAEVLCLDARGTTIADIAEISCASGDTVRHLLRSAYHRIAIAPRDQALDRTDRHGIVPRIAIDSQHGCSPMTDSLRAASALSTGVDEQLARWLKSEVLPEGRTDLPAALRVATALSRRGIRPGGGRTEEYLRTLTTLGAVDATLARVVEPHLDACAILDEAGVGVDIPEIGADDRSTWGVYAASAPGCHLEAQKGPAGWTLTGTKPWCSLSDRVSHAVVTASVSDAGQRAFAVRLDPCRVSKIPGQWISRGLTDITSNGIDMRQVPAVPVGGDDWYLTRPGFSWGAIGVAAVWYGITVAIGKRLTRTSRREPPDQISLAQSGDVDHRIFAAEVCLQHAATEIDAGRAEGRAGAVLAQRVRAVIADTAEHTMRIVGHALGPGPLTSDEEHARRVADLTVYIRQHHGERDWVRLGELLCAHHEHSQERSHA